MCVLVFIPDRDSIGSAGELADALGIPLPPEELEFFGGDVDLARSNCLCCFDVPKMADAAGLEWATDAIGDYHLGPGAAERAASEWAKPGEG